MRNLPPLNALRIFEVAARTGSYSEAAAELGLTHGAVSRQINALEIWLGQRLFARSGRRMVATPVAQVFAAEVSHSFDRLIAAAEACGRPEVRRILRVSAPTSFAMRWLIPQLAKGGGGPSCTQGNASPVGYQPYAACPEGAVPIAASQTSVAGRGNVDTTTSYSQSANGGECGTPTAIQTGSSDGCNRVYVGGVETVGNERTGATVETGGQCFALSARPANPTPYYVDITTTNGTSRFSFSIAGYGG